MDEDLQKIRIPVRLVVFDSIGTLLIVIGALQHFADIELIPEELLVENYGPLLILVGILLFAPMVLYIRRHLKESSRGN